MDLSSIFNNANETRGRVQMTPPHQTTAFQPKNASPLLDTPAMKKDTLLRQLDLVNARKPMEDTVMPPAPLSGPAAELESDRQRDFRMQDHADAAAANGPGAGQSSLYYRIAEEALGHLDDGARRALFEALMGTAASEPAPAPAPDAPATSIGQ